MARKRVSTAKLEIIQTAMNMFLEKGYSATSVKAIAAMLKISTGHLTFYYPTKEHMLAELTDMLCRFQWDTMRNHSNAWKNSLMSLCLELAVMAASCEEDEVAKDFYLAIYTHPMTLEIIRRNDIRRAKKIFASYCGDWSDEQYVMTETMTTGLEYAVLMVTGTPLPLEMRIERVLDSVMLLYQVPEDVRREHIRQTLSMDYRAISRQVIARFKTFIAASAEQAVAELRSENSK